jgi:2-dehydropantoate 2-reductase
VDAAERIAAIVGAGHVLGGATWISSAIEAPGVVKQASQFRRIVLGELDGVVSPRVQSIVEVLKQADIVAEATENIQKTLWTKFTFIASVSCVGPLTRLTMGEYRSVPEARELLFGVMREVKALAIAQGIILEDDVEKKSMEFIDAAAPHIKPSMQLDVEAGKKFELEAMIGVICRKGRELSVPTPLADTVYAALLPIELKARG